MLRSPSPRPVAVLLEKPLFQAAQHVPGKPAHSEEECRPDARLKAGHVFKARLRYRQVRNALDYRVAEQVGIRIRPGIFERFRWRRHVRYVDFRGSYVETVLAALFCAECQHRSRFRPCLAGRTDRAGGGGLHPG